MVQLGSFSQVCESLQYNIHSIPIFFDNTSSFLDLVVVKEISQFFIIFVNEKYSNLIGTVWFAVFFGRSKFFLYTNKTVEILRAPQPLPYLNENKTR